jgi:hypothetical protein
MEGVFPLLDNEERRTETQPSHGTNSSTFFDPMQDAWNGFSVLLNTAVCAEKTLRKHEEDSYIPEALDLGGTHTVFCVRVVARARHMVYQLFGFWNRGARPTCCVSRQDFWSP